MTPSSPHRIRWELIFAVWTAYGLLGAAQEHLSYAMSRGTPLPWGTALLMQMPLAYTWALATPVILWLGRRFPFERGRWPTSVAIHIAICLTFVFLVDLVYAFHPRRQGHRLDRGPGLAFGVMPPPRLAARAAYTSPA